jgi:FkbM family methyltransferase
VNEQRKNPDGYLKRAEPIAKKAIFDFLDQNGKMCFENTMNRPYATEIMEGLKQIADVRVIRVRTPIETAIERLQKRDQTTHVFWPQQEIIKIYNDSEQKQLDYDLTIDNNDLTENELMIRLTPLMEERVWTKDYVEITYRGQKMKFNSWSGESLTNYDMEYKPWKVAFEKENNGYLQHHELQTGEVVVDAGGYEGTFAIYATKTVGPTGKVIVFEPDTGNYEKLLANIKLNGLNNVVAINKALWKKDKKLKFNDKHTAGASFFFNASASTREIDAVSLDNELERLGIDKVDFIKMDVEGSEVSALQGAEKTIKMNNVLLAIATYHIVNGEETSADVEELLESFGYEAKTEFPRHRTTYAFKKGE